MPICGVLALTEWAERYVLCMWYQYVRFERSLELEQAEEGGGLNGVVRMQTLWSGVEWAKIS